MVENNADHNESLAESHLSLTEKSMYTHKNIDNLYLAGLKINDLVKNYGFKYNDLLTFLPSKINEILKI